MYYVLILVLLKVSVSNALVSSMPLMMYSNDSSLLKMSAPKTVKDEVNFFLFTKKNIKHIQKLEINNTIRLRRSSFNYNQSTKIIVHGWVPHEEAMSLFSDLKNAYVNATNYNIILVDWNKLAEHQYKIAHTFFNTVTIQLIEFLKFLFNNEVSQTQIHLIGHNLGAHIIGAVGKYFRNENKIIDAITGLDPAYPFYKFSLEEERLDKSDARYVEVIHTCSGYWGFRAPLGKVDFYPNGGINQPGCEHDDKGYCAHFRALVYYTESIEFSKPFTALYTENELRILYFTDTTINMSGVDLNYGAKEGVYFFRTNAESPFAAGHPSNWINGTLPPTSQTNTREQMNDLQSDERRVEISFSDKDFSH